MAASIEDRVKKIVVEQLGVKEDEAKNSASFVDDLGADSLDTVELVMALEEEFDCEIKDEEAEKIDQMSEGETLLPMVKSSGGNDWFMVKTQKGAVGWVKSADVREEKVKK